MSLADFRMLSKIGEGAYSSVHKVHRISDGREYALKKVRLNLLKDKEKQNALNEVRILASIENPYIISYKDAFIDDNTLCIVMEYAQGGDLEAKIKDLQRKRTHMDEREVWRLISHSLQGLQTLHDMKIMHRDLKSANIFVSNGCYKLGDLNVSKIVKNKLAYTQTGTPYYASPEVWRDQPYDSKSDIWSLGKKQIEVGCVIYEVCALRPPFQAKDMEGLFRRIQRGTFDRLPRNYSSELQKFIELCLQLNPQKRPDCKQLLQHPSLKEYESSPNDRENNLLQTIRMPKNLRNLKERLPKSKYESDAASERQRVPSQNSEVANRYRTDSGSNNQNYHNNLHLPSLSKNKEPIRKVAHSMNDGTKKAQQSQQIVLKHQDPENDNRLKDILREKQKIRELIELKERSNREEAGSMSLPAVKKQLARLLPVYFQSKPEEYSRPSWWG